MNNLMMIHCSKKKSNIILTAIFIIGLACVMAFLPIAQTVAYAESQQEFIEVESKVIGTVVGTIVASASASALLAGVGIVTTAGITAFVGSLLCIFAGVAISCALGTIAGWIISQLVEHLSQSSFDALVNSWDNAKLKCTMAAATFQIVVAEIKEALGISSDSTVTTAPVKKMFYTTDNTNLANTTIPDDVKDKNSYIINSNIDSGYFILYRGADSWKVGKTAGTMGSYNVYFNERHTWSLYYGDNVTFSFYTGRVTSSGGNNWAVIAPYLDEENKELNFRFLRFYYAFAMWNDMYKNPSTFRYNGHDLSFNQSNNHHVTFTDNDIKYELVAVDLDGIAHVPTSIPNLFYMLLIKHYGLSVFETTDGQIKDNTSTKLYKDQYLSKKSSASGTQTIKSTGTKSDDVTYDKTKDGVTSVVDSIKSTLDAGNTVTGDVTLGVTDVATASISSTAALSDCLVATSAVDMADVTATDATGDAVDMSGSQFIPWTTSLNMLQNSAGGIIDKFPFCIPSYLKSQLDIIVADPEEPIIKIPFVLETYGIDESMTLDFTKFEKVTKVTDWFLVIILIVGLCFATKKLMF